LFIPKNSEELLKILKNLRNLLKMPEIPENFLKYLKSPDNTWNIPKKNPDNSSCFFYPTPLFAKMTRFVAGKIEENTL
jgi:hypothetical protein